MCRYIIAGWLGILAVAGCKTGGAESGDELKSGDEGPGITAGEQQDDYTRIPVSLWSPGQRQSTASYYYLVAEYMALKERDARKALPVYEAAYSLDPNPFLGGKMLVARAAAGERAEAMLEARKMVLLYPRDARLRFYFGEMLMQSGNLQEAAEQLERCIELDPAMEGAYIQLADTYQAMKQVSKAVTVARDHTKNLPGSVAAWTQLARFYLLTSQHKEALVPARRAWEMQSNNPHLAQLYAIVLQLNGKTKQAISIYEQLYRLDPTDEEMTARMIELYRELGNLESALKLLQDMSAESSKRRPAVEIQMAILLWELKRNDEALQVLERLLKDHPDSDRVRYLTAFACERTEKFDRALEIYRGIPEASSLRPQADLRMIVILKHQKKFDEADAIASVLLKAEKPEADVYGVIGGLYADAKRFEDAIKLMNDAYAKYPDRHQLLFMRGVYEEKAGDIEACMATMRQVISQDPKNSSAHNYLGYLYAERGENLDEAEQLIKKALEIKPDDGFYLDSLGWVYYQKKEYDKALPVLEKALEKEPKEGVIMEHVADVKLMQGDRKGAQELYEKALQQELEEKDRTRIEKKYKELKGS